MTVIIKKKLKIKVDNFFFNMGAIQFYFHMSSKGYCFKKKLYNRIGDQPNDFVLS